MIYISQHSTLSKHTLQCLYIGLYGESVALDKKPSTPHIGKLEVRVIQSHEVESPPINALLGFWISFYYVNQWCKDKR